MFLYKITNLITGQVYIGQTVQSISTRWASHKYASKIKDTYLYKAIRKYGIENFTIEEIGGANSISELNYLEKHCICQYNSLVPNGYNIQTGGNNSKHSKETVRKMSQITTDYFKKNKHSRAVRVVDIDTDIVYPSIRKASLACNISQVTLVQYLKGDVSNPTGLRYLDKENSVKKPTKKASRAKEVIEIATGKKWKSVRQCALEINVDNRTLSYRINKGIGGFKYVRS